VKYFLNHISPTLAAIARALACEGIGHTHSYAEEIRRRPQSFAAKSR